MTYFVVLCMLNHCDTVMAYLESSREHVHYHLSLLEKTNPKLFISVVRVGFYTSGPQTKLRGFV